MLSLFVCADSPLEHLDRAIAQSMKLLLAVLVVQLLCNARALTTKLSKTVVVFGATGRVGRLAVKELLDRDQQLSVRCIVRSLSKAKEILPSDPRVESVEGNLERNSEIQSYCTGADSAIWCAAGFSDASSPISKVVGALKLKFSPAAVIDIKALGQVGSQMSTKEGVVPGGPTVVMCSSAGVTRPTWSAEKKLRLVGAADIPIVRLNPLNILDIKRKGEDGLRVACGSAARYTIVRPCGLNDATPRGRPLLSQGDVAVGRISRADAAKLLVDALLEPSACGKTLEALALPNFPYPSSLSDQLTRLKRDAEPGPDESALFATYALLQQIVPGTTMRPNELAMGQTYEQLDKGQEGRLGARGTETAPITRS